MSTVCSPFCGRKPLGWVLVYGLRILVASSFIVSLVSCASTNTKTNKDSSYTEHPKRIFVIANLNAFGPGFAEDFQALLVHGVTSCGGSVEFSEVAPSEISNPLALTPQQNAIDATNTRVARMHEFAPDALLLMRVTHVGTTNGQLTQVVINSQVYDVKAKKVVWAGVSNMAAGGMFTPTSTRAKSLYADLSAKLQSDGIFPACLGISQTSAPAATH